MRQMADITDQSSLDALVSNAPIQVRSSLINQIQYDATNKLLTVAFNKGGVFEYQEVSPEEYQGLLSASSAGKYFLANIKGHAFKKVG